MHMLLCSCPRMLPHYSYCLSLQTASGRNISRCPNHVASAFASASAFACVLQGVEAVPPARFTLKCSVCNKRDAGACIQCDSSACAVAFHPLCMLHDDIVFKTARKNKGSFKLAAYCPTHSATARARLEDADDGPSDGGANVVAPLQGVTTLGSSSSNAQVVPGATEAVR
jgi:hypothetical protein